MKPNRVKLVLNDQFSQILIQNDVSQNEFLSGKFEKVDVDNKMSHTCGPFEPINSTQNDYFRFLITL